MTEAWDVVRAALRDTWNDLLTTALCESAMGFVILLLNGGLLYLATLLPNYFLFAFAITGLLVGTWITMPADSQ